MTAIKKFLSLLLRVGISAILLALLFRQEHVDLKGIIATLHKADAGLLWWAFLIFASANILSLYRWVMLLHAASLRPPLRRVITSFSGGLFF